MTETPTGTEAEVCADIARRQANGFSKYGTTVADNPLTLKQWLQHAYEEALDNAIYLKRAIGEIEKQEPAPSPVQTGFCEACGSRENFPETYFWNNRATGFCDNCDQHRLFWKRP